MFPPVFILRPGGPTSRHGEQIRPPLPRELIEGNDENDGDVKDAGMIIIHLVFIIMTCTLVRCPRTLPRRPV